MKKTGELYTVRGQVADAKVDRITLFDGSFETGYRVVEFKVTANQPNLSNSDCWATLATEEDAATVEWSFEDQRQIGWTGSHVTTFGGAYAQDAILDPDNLIIEDLYIYGNCGSGSTHVNYLITLQKYDIKDWDGALAMVRNKSQG